MDRSSLIFCASALVLSLLTAMVALPLASLSPDTIERAKSVVAPSDLGELNLGAFGMVSVSDMLTYYVENPPEQKNAGEPQRKVRFEGC